MSKNIRLNGNLYLAVLKMGLAAEQSAFDAALSDQQSGSRPPRRFAAGFSDRSGSLARARPEGRHPAREFLGLARRRQAAHRPRGVIAAAEELPSDCQRGFGFGYRALCQRQSARRRISTCREAYRISTGRRSAQEQRDWSGRVRALPYHRDVTAKPGIIWKCRTFNVATA
jgi:hypothetical protein